MEYPIPYRKYQEQLAGGAFVGMQCSTCGSITFPPMAVCRDCSGAVLTPVSLSGKGRLRTFTVVRVAPEGRKPPYIVAMVELEEGPFVLGNLINVPPDQATMSLMGKRVQLGSRLVEGDPHTDADTHALTFSVIE